MALERARSGLACLDLRAECVKIGVLSVDPDCALPEQEICAWTAGNGIEQALLADGLFRSIQGAALFPGLDDDHGAAEAADDAVARGEVEWLASESFQIGN